MATREIANKNGDWRIAITATLAQDLPAAYPGGPSHKAGSYLSVSHHLEHPRHGPLEFITPHAAALALNTARRSAKEASRLRTELGLNTCPAPGGPTNHIGPNDKLYDYFEHCQVAATFSFQAIESYANSIIAWDPGRVIRLERKDENGGKVLRDFTPEEVERRCPTEEKIATVLPRILNRPSIKGKRAWHDFKTLKKARDATVHMKSVDQFGHQPATEDSLFFHFFDNAPMNYPAWAFAVIWHFCKTDVPAHQKPDWAQRYVQFLKEELE